MALVALGVRNVQAQTLPQCSASVNSFGATITLPATPIGGSYQCQFTAGLTDFGLPSNGSGLWVTLPGATGGLSVSSTCGGNGYTGGACANTEPLTVTFSPTGTAAVSVAVAGSTNVYNRGGFNGNLYVRGTTRINGTVSVSPSALVCPAATVGTQASCGTVTVTANDGAVSLASTPFTWTAGPFSVAGGTCSPGGTISSGASCTLEIGENASAPGSYASTLTVNTSGSGSATVGVSGSVSAFSCVPNAAQGKYCLVTPL